MLILFLPAIVSCRVPLSYFVLLNMVMIISVYQSFAHCNVLYALNKALCLRDIVTLPSL